MRSINTYYTNFNDLKTFMSNNEIKDSGSLLIQIFTAYNTKDYISNLLSQITSLFPHAIIIGATTDGEIMNGEVSEQATVLSFSIFESTTILSASQIHTDDGFLSGQNIAKQLIKNDTKAIISFSAGLNTSGEAYLNGICSIDKEVIVAGGLAADNAEFICTYVFTKDEIFDCGCVAVSLNSSSLSVYNEYAYSWDRVGVELTITEAKDNRVYTIDNKKTCDVYAHYLGEDIASRLPESGTEFPLVINRDGLSISRAVMSVESDGSLIFAGNFKVGDVVQFGYGNVNGIFEQSLEVIKHVSKKPAEAIFIYSCMARRHYLSNEIEAETLPLNSIAPTTGFFTYGEFFSSKRRELLNQTMTLLVLSESNDIKNVDNESLMSERANSYSSMSSSVNALANLVKVASSELNEKTALLEVQKNSLYYQANHDSLTGLSNRVLFNDRLSHAIKIEQRHKEKLALLFIDLDNFKIINDSLGHDVGDKLLKCVSRRLIESVRDSDTLARLGGDEFAIILEDAGTIENISSHSNKILKSLSREFNIDEHIFHISCSIGISIFPDDSDCEQNLLKFADVAMYKAKDEGKNNFQFYSSDMTKLVLEKIELEENLRKAISEQEFELHYQPQMNTKTNTIKGVEALIRWNHPQKGFIPPDKFIPYAEKSWLIIAIDTWVMNEAMKQVSQWYKEGLNPGVLSLNLAMKQLESDNFMNLLNDTMKKYSFKSEWLKLEVLERDIMKKPEQSIIKLQEISSLGVSLAIDDFGTGQSSFTYLKRFPLNELKIDKSFVDDIPEDEEDKAIVRAVIALTEALNLDTIAEGVETPEQLKFLQENGCHNIQGYYFSKPLPVEQIKEFLIKV